MGNGDILELGYCLEEYLVTLANLLVGAFFINLRKKEWIYLG